MQISVIGTGYVGLVTGTCFSDLGNVVLCVDQDHSKIESLTAGKVPFYEPGLTELIHRNFESGRLKFGTSLSDAFKNSDMIFIAVGTPSTSDGQADTSSVFSVVEQLATYLKSSKDRKILVTKSTVPVGTGRKIVKLLADKGLSDDRVSVLSNPEFLREGSAIEDFLRPDRIVIGGGNDASVDSLASLYAPLYRLDSPIIKTSLETAELSKYAANAFLATKISFINEMANLCDRLSADVRDISKIMGTDGRIGKYFLHPGPGYGGSCFPKDTTALIHIAETVGYDLKIVKAVEEVNAFQKRFVAKELSGHFPDGLSGRVFGILGLAFKPNTDDIREAPALTIIQDLLDKGASIQIYDPEAMENGRKLFGKKITFAADPYAVADHADGVILVTEWNVFRELDLIRLKSTMKSPLFLDLRNVYSPKQLRSAGFDYYVIGRGTNAKKYSRV